MTNMRPLILTVVHGVMIVAALAAFFHGMAGSFFIQGPYTSLQLLFVCLTWLAWLPLSLLAIFAKRTAAILMILSIAMALAIHGLIPTVKPPSASRIWLLDSTLPLAISAIVLWIMAKALPASEPKLG